MKPNHLLTLIAFLAGSILPLAAQDAPVTAPSTAIENSLLWEITGPGMETPSYLYGTIHMIGKDDFFLTKETKTAFEATDRITFEIDLAEMSNLFSQFALMMQVFMDDGIRISDLLTEEDYQIVSNHFDGLGMPMFALDRIKPLFLSMMTDMDVSSMGGGQSDMVSYEYVFYDMAVEREMETGGLETAEYQIGLFDSIPYQVQAEMLLDAVKTASEPAADTTETESEMDMLVEMYKSEDINSMQSAFTEEDSEYAEYEDLLLNNRNRNWIPVMIAMMAEKPTFFAVGAGHLGGPNGVIALLRTQGYTLRPLHNPGQTP